MSRSSAFEFDILSRLEALRGRIGSLPSDQAIATEKITGFEDHRIGMTTSGDLCYVLRIPDCTGRVNPPIRLQRISVDPCIACEIVDQHEARTERSITLIRTHQLSDSEIVALDGLMQASLALISTGAATIDSSIEGIIESFQRLRSPGTRSLIGLFGELVFIRAAKSSIAALKSWRSRTDSTFDFWEGSLRVEVKSTVLTLREHSFSAEQCAVANDEIGLVASILLTETGNGYSTNDLVAEIDGQLQSETAPLEERAAQRAKLYSTVIETIEGGLETANNTRFDLDSAVASIRLFDVSKIPRLLAPFPTGISNVRFTSRLDEETSIKSVETIPIADSARLLLPRLTFPDQRD